MRHTFDLARGLPHPLRGRARDRERGAPDGLPTPVDGSAPGYFGVYPAIVTNLVDPDRLGRIEVRFPWLGTDGDQDVRAWATLCTPYADGDQGLQILPEVDSQVVVAFEAGNLRRPYIVGCDLERHEPRCRTTPTTANNIRMLRTRAGSRLEFDDGPGAAKVTVKRRTGTRWCWTTEARRSPSSSRTAA